MFALHDPLLAHLVLQQYGLAASRLELLHDVRHVTYHVQTNEHRRFSLRICPVTPRMHELLNEELLWLEFIDRHHQVQVPVPVPNRAGRLVTSIDHHPYLACLFRWIEGQPATPTVTPAALSELGRAIAVLHTLARSFPLPDARPFRSGFFYDSRLVHAHRTWLATPHAARTASQSALVDAALTVALNGFSRMDTDPAHFGLIHADIHLGNVLLTGTHVAIIDFEQLGWGYFGYDLAVLYAELTHISGSAIEAWQHVLTGYQSIAALPFDSNTDFVLILAAVHLAFLDRVYNAESPAVWQEQSPRLPAVYDALEGTVRDATA